MAAYLPLPASALEGNGDPFPDFMKVSQIAETFKMHPGSVWRLIHDGTLPSVKRFGVCLTPRTVVEMFETNYRLQPGRKQSPFLI